jgi:hypothetical protein
MGWSRCSAAAYAPLRGALARSEAPTLQLGLWPDHRGRGLFAARDLEPGTLLLREPPYAASHECPTHLSSAGKELSALAEEEPSGTSELSRGDRWELVEDALLVALCLFRGAHEAADPAPGAPPLPVPPQSGSSEDDVALLGPLLLLEHAPLPSALPLAGVQLLHERLLPLSATLAAEICLGVAQQQAASGAAAGAAQMQAWAALMPRCEEAWRSESLLCVLTPCARAPSPPLCLYPDPRSWQ